MSQYIFIDSACILVICPLRSLIGRPDSRSKINGFDNEFSSEDSHEDVGAGKFQYSSTENVLEKEFFTFLKAGDNIPQKPGCSRS